MSQPPSVTSVNPPGTPSGVAKVPPPATGATPSPAKKKAAPKKRKEPTGDGVTPPPAKKRKKEDTTGEPKAPSKRASAKKSKAKEPEEPQVAKPVDDAVAAERRAQWEAEEEEAKGEEDEDVNAWDQNRRDTAERDYTQRFGLLYSMMTPAQEERYSKFRSSAFDYSEVKKEVLDPIGIHASEETSTVLKSIGKVFVGEIIDTAQGIMEEWGDVGAIRPIHLREAYRRMEAAGTLPNAPKTLKFGGAR